MSRTGRTVDTQAIINPSDLAGSELDRSGSVIGHRALIKLSLNENPFGPSSLASEALRSRLRQVHRYADCDVDSLIAAIIARDAVNRECVVLGDVLGVLGDYLSRRDPCGGEFIYSEPGYTGLVRAAALAGGTLVGVPLDQNLENDLPAIAAKVGAKTKAIYLANPHNPTGTVSKTQSFLQFVRQMSKSTIVIVDEAYIEFTSDPENRTVANLIRSGHNVVVFRTFAKMFGLAGLPMGYLIAPEALASSLTGAGGAASETLDHLAVTAAVASLGDATYVEATRAAVATERAAWHRLFAILKLPHAESHANYVFFHTGQPHDAFAAALRERGIEIGRPFLPLDDWARISIGLPEDNAIARRAVVAVLKAR